MSSLVSVVSGVFEGSVSVLEELDFSDTSDEVDELFDEVDGLLEVSVDEADEVLSFEDVFVAISDGFIDTFIATGFAVTDELLTFSETKTPL